MSRCGRNMGCSSQKCVSAVTIIILSIFGVHLPVDASGEEDGFNHQRSLQSRQLLPGGPIGSSINEAQILLEFRDNVLDANGTLESWNVTRSSNVCSWAGVQCDQAGSVLVLDLSGFGLAGVIPSALGNLQLLSSIVLSGNSFYGALPSSLGNLRYLQNLDISRNNLTSFPPQLSNWTSLTSLNLSRNALTGFLPVDIGNLQNLSVIDVQCNHLTSYIPSSLGNCSSLSWLSLGVNQFVGTIPADLGRLTKLTTLRLHLNNLTGPIPSSIYNLSLLNELNLENNLLSGEISSDVGLLTNLTTLKLDVNNFTGSIPSTIGNLSLLGNLMIGGAALLGGVSVAGPDSWLGGEWLTGGIPVEIGNLRNLKVLWIYRTKCTGTIPSEIGNLPNLRFLYIFHNLNLAPSVIPPTFSNLTSNLFALFLKSNNFRGSIPPWIGNFANVGFLDLRTNGLTGELPPELGNLTSAWRLLLSGNSLRGPIVPEIGKLSQLSDLGLDQNWLSGPLPLSLANLTGLQNLYLYQNNLSGMIPPAMLANMPFVGDFCISHNQFSGPIPVEIGHMFALNCLDLSHNQLSGTIPPEIGKCYDLTVFNISHNRISGELPISSLEDLESLEYFLVDDNLLEGPVPPHNGTFKNVTVNYDGNAGMCGPGFGKNCSSSVQPQSAGQKCRGLNASCHHGWIFVIAGVGTALLAIVAGLGFLCWRMSTRKPFAPPHLQTSEYSEVGDDFPGDFPDLNLFIKDMTLTVDDLWAATGGFSQESILGKGGSSTVYKAMLANQKRSLIAVKCVHLDTADRTTEKRSSTRDLHNELRILGSLRHRNLVRLYGVCSTSKFKALLLEHVPGGSLQLHLQSCEKQGRPLTLESRIRIAVGVADALVYLHNDAHRQIIHRDLKPSNILLDHDFNPKVADFGISKFVKQNGNEEVTASSLFGSTGYIPPEYATSTSVSTKGDVYSFGVIVLEMLTGKAPTDNGFGKDGTLREWVLKASPDGVVDILDNNLKSDAVTHERELHLLVHVGLLCTHGSPTARPSMMEVKRLLAEVNESMVEQGGHKNYPSLQELAEQPTLEKHEWISQAQQVATAKPRSITKPEIHPIQRDSPSDGLSSGANSPGASSSHGGNARLS